MTKATSTSHQTMNEVPSSVILTTIIIIATCLVLTGVIIIVSIVTESQNKIINTGEKTVNTEWSEQYMRYDGMEVTGAEIIALIKDNQKIVDPIPILVTINGTDYNFNYGSGTSTAATNAQMITKAKQAIDDTTIYIGEAQISETSNIYALKFVPK